MDSSKKTAIDLFCGAGGLTVGLKKAGFEIVVAVEKDEIASETYRLNHKKIKLIEDDIKNVDALKTMRDLGLKKGQLDLLAGCPPCQGFSSLRTRNKKISEKDERNNLIFQYLKWVEVFKPKTIMLENVPALAKDYRIKKILKRLAEIGYSINEETVSIVNAADYGVPQRRRRMLLLAGKKGTIPQPRKSLKQKSVRDFIFDLAKPGKSGDLLHDLPVVRTLKIEKLIKMVPKNGGSRTDLPKKYWLECHKRYPKGFTDVYGRLSWDMVAPTITGGCIQPSKGRYLHPQQNRAITLREAALLQAFPKTYKFSLKRGKEMVALMIGNALPPEMIRRHATAIQSYLNQNN